MKKYSYILFALAIGILSSCGGENKSTGEESVSPEDSSLIEITKEQFSSMNMEIAPLQEHEFDAVVRASGKIDVPPQKRAKVTSFVAGFVKSTSLLVGSKVTKGQALLTLESPEYIDMQQSYMEISSQLSYLKSEYERQKTLFEEKISSQKKYLEAESEYKRAKATHESLRQKLNMLRINPNMVEQGKLASSITVYAPVSGDVTLININVGMAISPTDVLIEIVDTKAMHLELAVFEKDIFNLKTVQRIKFVIPQVSTDEFEARISQIGKSIEGKDRIINVYATLDDNAKEKLMTGMFVEARIVADSRNALSVPFDAVASEEGSHFLLILESEKEGNYTFRKTLVQIGERNGDWIEITSDNKISSDSKVLVKGVYDVM